MTKESLSFTSAEAWPVKVLCNFQDLRERFFPIHISITPTNRCNLNCRYCSCRNENRQLEMGCKDFEALLHLMVGEAGVHAVTFTGGGEPLLHPFVDGMMGALLDAKVKVGLVTNGMELHGRSQAFDFASLDWIRVSMDVRRRSLPWTPKNANVAFSYVWGTGSQYDKHLLKLMQMARSGDITHLRIVSDICRADDEEYYFPSFKAPFRKEESCHHPRIIWQDRSKYTRGARHCWVSLVKPIVDPIGRVFPCCGAQYALKNHPAQYPEQMCMGTFDKYLENHVEKQIPFDGSICDICYYSKINEMLDIIKRLGEVQSPEFL